MNGFFIICNVHSTIANSIIHPDYKSGRAGVNTIRLQLNANNIHTQWSEIVRVMNTQKLVTTTMKNEYEQIITIRQCSEPITEVEKIYQALHYKLRPFGRKKSVVTPSHIFENATRIRQDNPG